MKVSIVIAYYNRKALLINTLKSIEFYNKDREIEVIIVDDASDKSEKITDLPAKFSIPIIILPITREEKKWTNPCVPYNIGFSFATGDIIIIQNPECLHVGDIVQYATNNIKDGVYLSFACYSLNKTDSEKLFKNISTKPFFNKQNIEKSIGGFIGAKNNWQDGDTCWYNHSEYNPGGNHFCSAITRHDIEALSGFDERYATGFGYDDIEFIARIKTKPITTKIVDDPFVIHQWHKVSDYVKNQAGFKRNQNLYVNHTAKEPFYKAIYNNFFAQKEEKPFRVGVIIVNLNQLELTKKCISDLRDQANKNFDIFLYDQYSGEKGTTEYLNECKKNGIAVFRNIENVPLNHIWDNFKNICSCEYLCFLNNDTELSNMFIDDTINIFKAEPKVGFVIHVTNHLSHLKTKGNLEYKILNPPYYQGWDFTIRRYLMPEIPKELIFFAGDDYIFAKVVSQGYDIALAYSSPILHHGSRTRATISNIDVILQRDGMRCCRILKEQRLTRIDITINGKQCYEKPMPYMKIIQ